MSILAKLKSQNKAEGKKLFAVITGLRLDRKSVV